MNYQTVQTQKTPNSLTNHPAVMKTSTLKVMMKTQMKILMKSNNEIS